MVAAVVDMCQATAALGHRVVLATCDAKDAPGAWKEQSCGPSPAVVELPSPGRPRFSVWQKRQLDQIRSVLANVKPDVAHLHTPWDVRNCNVRQCCQMGVPYVATVHGMLDHWCMGQKSLKKQAFLKLGGRRLFEHAAAVHFTAEGRRRGAGVHPQGGESEQSCRS